MTRSGGVRGPARSARDLDFRRRAGCWGHRCSSSFGPCEANFGCAVRGRRLSEAWIGGRPGADRRQERFGISCAAALRAGVRRCRRAAAELRQHADVYGLGQVPRAGSGASTPASSSRSAPMAHMFSQIRVASAHLSTKLRTAFAADIGAAGTAPPAGSPTDSRRGGRSGSPPSRSQAGSAQKSGGPCFGLGAVSSAVPPPVELPPPMHAQGYSLAQAAASLQRAFSEEELILMVHFLVTAFTLMLPVRWALP